MSPKARKLACCILLLTVTFASASQTTAQYTWRNVQIYGGGFIVGIVFNQPLTRVSLAAFT